MTMIDAVIQGIIQGITEFLPVSSSGHLSISQHFFGIRLPGILFDILLHLGTLVAVLVLYRKTVWLLIKEFFKLLNDLLHRRFQWRKMDHGRQLLLQMFVGLLPLFLLFLPIPGTDMRIKDFAEKLATDNGVLAEGFALIATGALLFLGMAQSRKKLREKIVVDRQGMPAVSSGRRRLNILDALLIGLAQMAAAVFPGLSRSGATLSVGLMRGLNKKTALNYSFVLGIPAILAAVLVSIKDAGSEEIATVGIPVLAVGAVVSCVVGFFAIRLLQWIVASDKLRIFAWYAFILGSVVLVLGIVEKITKVGIFTGTPLG